MAVNTTEITVISEHAKKAAVSIHDSASVSTAAEIIQQAIDAAIAERGGCPLLEWQEETDNDDQFDGVSASGCDGTLYWLQPASWREIDGEPPGEWPTLADAKAACERHWQGTTE